jgi:hypothetical protein
MVCIEAVLYLYFFSMMTMKKRTTTTKITINPTMYGLPLMIHHPQPTIQEEDR